MLNILHKMSHANETYDIDLVCQVKYGICYYRDITKMSFGSKLVKKYY